MKKRLWGLILIVLGILVFLQALEVYDFGLSFWHTLLLLLGIAILSESISFGLISWVTLGLGLWIGAIGLFGILSNAGVIDISGSDIARFGWPLILVAVGLSIILGDRNVFFRKLFYRHRFDEADWSGHSQMRHIGDLYHGRTHWTMDRDLEFFNGIGDVEIDFTTADIKPGTHHVYLKAGLGDVTIRVPDGVNVEVDASVGLGELEVFGEQKSGIGGLTLKRVITVEGADATIRVEAKMGIGDMKIIYTPAVSG
jgi:lia operon protein LiaF